jgi:hypothetical protein
MNERIILLDWNTIVLVSMLFFVLTGARKGWQRALVTLVALFFAWGVSIKTVDFLLRAFEFMFGIAIGESGQGLFQVLLYLSTAVMVFVTFNIGNVIPVSMLSRRDRLSGMSVGILNGYFFVVLLLDIGRVWFAENFEGFALTLDGGLMSEGLMRAARVIVRFVNNPIDAYDQLVQAQNLVLLGLLVVFFHGFIFWLLGGLNQALQSSSGAQS